MLNAEKLSSMEISSSSVHEMAELTVGLLLCFIAVSQASMVCMFLHQLCNQVSMTWPLVAVPSHMLCREELVEFLSSGSV